MSATTSQTIWGGGSFALEFQFGYPPIGGQLPALDAWVPPWRGQPAPAAPRAARNAARGVALLAAYPATCDAVAVLLGCDDPWEAAEPAPSGAALLGRHPDTVLALEVLLTRA